MIFVTHFFNPEIGAASHRISALAMKMVEDNENLFVITTTPSYKLEKKVKYYESKEKLKIIRFPIFHNNSKNIILRLITMLSFSFYLILLIPLIIFLKDNRVFIQGHPLISSFFSILIFKKIFSKKIILNVSDLWPKSGLELGVFKKGYFYSMLKMIEKFNYKNSDLIITQSKESKSYISKILPKKNIHVFYNVPRSSFHEKKINKNTHLNLIYAGLLGHAQNVLETCKMIDFDASNIIFTIYGEGSQKKEIIHYIKENNISNIKVNDFISRESLNQRLIESDIGLVQLKQKIYGALPSKLFHYLNYNLPILYIGEGEASEIINGNAYGWTFKNNDYDGVNSLIKKINVDREALSICINNIKNNFKLKFNYDLQYQNFSSKIKL